MPVFPQAVERYAGHTTVVAGTILKAYGAYLQPFKGSVFAPYLAEIYAPGGLGG